MSFRKRISSRQLSSMLWIQGDKCKLCRDPLHETTAKLDHCHVSGRIRGLLCHRCNVALGMLRDNPRTMLYAVEYVSPGFLEEQIEAALYDGDVRDWPGNWSVPHIDPSHAERLYEAHRAMATLDHRDRVEVGKVGTGDGVTDEDRIGRPRLVAVGRCQGMGDQV